MYCFTFELLCQKRQAENFAQSYTYINIQFTLAVKSCSPSFTFLNRLSWRRGKKCKIWWSVSGICFILFWYFKPVFNFLPIMYPLLNPYYATLNPAPVICVLPHPHIHTAETIYIQVLSANGLSINLYLYSGLKTWARFMKSLSWRQFYKSELARFYSWE